ncbi:MAG: type IX secretion system sortase PorU [bacterium]|nr:type IX secretion system sortase PorU [bacterium]
MKRTIKNNRISLFRRPAILGMLALILVFSLSLRRRYHDFKQEEILVITEDQNGINVEYTPGLELVEENIGGRNITRFMIKDGILENMPGTPLIPYRNFLTAVPEDAAPEVNVITLDYTTINNIIPELFPGIKNNGSVRLFPDSEHLIVENTVMIRLRRVLPVKVMPVIYDQETGSARLLTKISFRIDYNTGGSLKPENKLLLDKKFNSIYRNVILNSNSEETWSLDQPSGGLKKGSLLETGNWYVIPVMQEGIYRITYQDLTGFGLSPSNIDPRTIKIYSNGGGQLPEGISTPGSEGLLENAVRVVGEEDGNFDADDHIVFYARGTQSWDWNSSRSEIIHNTNLYSKTNYYWFTYGGDRGKRMVSVPYTEVSGTPETTGKSLVHTEYERENIYQSGSNWYITKLLKDDDFRANINLPGYAENTNVDFRILTASSADVNKLINFRINGSTVFNSNFSGETERLFRFSKTFNSGQDFSFYIKNTSAAAQSNIYLDWYEIEYDQTLTAVGDSLKFLIEGVDAVKNFSINGFTTNNIDIYNITDFAGVKHEEYSVVQSGSVILFSDTLKNEYQVFYAIERNRYKAVTVMTAKENSDLRTRPTSPDMIIITPEEFYDAVLPLRDHRETQDTLDVEVVTIENIYDEFSGGMVDPVAIRDFLKFAFENWRDQDNEPPMYILLVGDGHFDYHEALENSYPMRIPAFQYNSIHHITSRVTDDFYGWVSGNDQYLDFAIGRLPVNSAGAAEDLVQKIIRYETEPEYGPWRNTITFIADDEVTTSSQNEALHTQQSELLANSDYIPKYLDQRKIYLMEYQPERSVTSSSIKKPDAQNDLVDQINEGTLILNYIGHGNERLLAHEWILHREVDMPRIHNENKPMFFYLASCAFARWDMPDDESMAELLLTEPEKGAIALISAARDVFASSNFQLAKAFYTNFFNSDRTTATLGEANMLAKLSVPILNSQKYILLGDPAMRLTLPQNKINIVSVMPDSLKALATVRVRGAVNENESLNGKVYLSVYDSEKDAVHYMSNNSPVNYKLPGSGIFKGKVSFNSGENSEFNVDFIVPKDITYGGENGRISLYAWDENGDASVFLDELPVGGTAEGITDNDGPEMELFFNDMVFMSGDLVSQNSDFKIKLSDPVGINTTGEVGHKIELSFDDDPNIINLSRSFEYYEGSYTEGEALYSLDELTTGPHTITVRAWDSFNNSTRFSGIVHVSSENILIIEKVMNYPNPFNDMTQFTCQINTSAEITIKIFTLRGRLIKILDNQHTGNSSFFVSDTWDGRDEDGDPVANGTYLYKLIVNADINGERQQVEKLGKLVIMR